MVCNINTCPWKVTTHAVGGTQIVQVHTFKNMHNHCVDNATFEKPIVRAKCKSALVDDVIKAILDYLIRQLCKDFAR